MAKPPAIQLPPLTPPVKRSVMLDGHATSVSLEDAFWRALQDEARTRNMTPAQLISRVDHERPAEVGLATALRLFVLAQAQARMQAQMPAQMQGRGQLAPPPRGD